MRVVYLGTPDFAVLPLKSLLEIDGVEIVGVVTNKDKPVGRRMVLTAPPVKTFAIENNLPVYQYDKIRIEGVDDLKALSPDLMITCAFGQILSKEILEIAKLGVINIHASLLPKYRGASPINFAILNGEKTTGVTIMKTDEGVDTGDIIYSEEIEIGEEETAKELFNKLSILGAKCIKKVVKDLMNGEMKTTPQEHDKATKTTMITKQMAKLDFSKDAQTLVNTIRAFNPWPIAYAVVNGENFKIYKAKAVTGSGKEGEVIRSDDKIVIACKDGAIELLEVQKSGGKVLDVKDFLKGNKFAVGTVFND